MPPRPSALLVLPLLASLTAPSMVASASTLRFPTRVVELGPIEALPSRGLIYLELGRALRRDEIGIGRQSGLRYLGAIGSRTYAFELSGDKARPFVLGWDPVVAGAAAKPEDKLEPSLLDLEALGTTAAAKGLGLTVRFWPHATRAEVEALLGAPDGLRLPRSEGGRLGPESSVVLTGAASRWLEPRRLAAHPAVAAVGVDLPKVELNDSSRGLAGTDLVASDPYGLTGEGILIGHWDGGSVDDDHPDFGGRVENLTRTGVSSHATHTAGTILGNGTNRASARGHAPGARMVALSFNGNPTAERREVKHLFYHHHDNHSWGQNSQTVRDFGTYNQVAFEFDIDGRDLLLLPVKAAGNDGQASEVIVDNFGFDSLSPDSTAKNSLVVGATEPNGQLAPYSSRGPTQDGRIKPDLVAVGSGVVSTRPGGGYYRAQGTSMSAPGVTGMLALLSELYERESAGRRLHPDTARGVLIHTARDAFNRGPDYRYGWGIADVRAAADLILADRASGGRQLVRGAVRDGERMEYELDVVAGEPELKVTLSWLDAFINGTASRRLLNDIDLSLVSPSGARFQSWVLDPQNPLEDAAPGRNSVDNVEQVLVANPEVGRWTVVIDGADVTDPDLFVQGFVLVTDRPVSRDFVRVVSPLAGADIPDGDGALEIPFEVGANATVDALRVHLDLQHEARGQVRIELTHPDGTTVTLETEDTSSRRDIYAIYPDLRSYDDDVLSLYGKPAAGTWTVTVRDLEAGDTGTLRHAELELDLGGPPNQAPIAQIEGPTVGAPGSVRTLSGAASSDPDGDALRLSWRQVAGPEAGLSGLTLDALQIRVPDAAVGTELRFELEVTDGRGGRAVAIHTLTITAPNMAPSPQIVGPNRASPGAEVEFDASGSTDPDGDALSFAWSQTGGPAIEAASADGARWRFTVPEADPETFIGLRVAVSDGKGGEVAVTFDLVVAERAPAGGGSDPGPSGQPGGGGELDAAEGCTTAGPGALSPLLLLAAGLFFLAVRPRRRALAPVRRRRN